MFLTQVNSVLKFTDHMSHASNIATFSLISCLQNYGRARLLVILRWKISIKNLAGSCTIDTDVHTFQIVVRY